MVDSSTLPWLVPPSYSYKQGEEASSLAFKFSGSCTFTLRASSTALSSRCGGHFPECRNWWRAQPAFPPAFSVGRRCEVERGSASLPPRIMPHDRGVMRIPLPCSQLRDWLTHTSIIRAGSIVLPRRGAGTALPFLWPEGQVSHVSQLLKSGVGQFSPTPAAGEQMSNRTALPVLTAPGLAHAHVHHRRG